MIAAKFNSIDELMDADIESLTAINEIGPKIASSIIAYFQDQDNIQIINRLKQSGLNLSEKENKTATRDTLKGKSIVISGVFRKHTLRNTKK
jgi:DNA ligase (NAD+)